MSARLDTLAGLRGLKVTVMGLGLHGGGLACAKFLARYGAKVRVTDTKSEAELRPSIEALEGLGVEYTLGRHDMADFTEADFVVKNPAVRPDSPYVRAARQVESDLSLFLRFNPARVIAVTGSKGKSSTSSAIHFGLAQAGLDAHLGGNITISPLDFLDKLGGQSLVVLELSSWQLADLRGLGLLRPKIALLTSIMPDHMNRYSGMEEYVADKRLIYADQGKGDATLCNKEDPYGLSFAAQTPAQGFFYSDRPLAKGERGAWLEGEIGYMSLDGSPGQEILGPNCRLPGPHMRKNLLAAALALGLQGIEAGKIRDSLSRFPGVEHRLELFLERGGRRFYNDSAATIPQAAEAAVRALSDPIILITGGTDKELDFSTYRDFARKPKALILLAGSGSQKLQPILDDMGLTYEGPEGDFRKAVARALELSAPGDSILLSPGCASFGMFAHEFDRGRQFRELCRELSAGLGET